MKPKLTKKEIAEKAAKVRAAHKRSAKQAEIRRIDLLREAAATEASRQEHEHAAMLAAEIEEALQHDEADQGEAVYAAEREQEVAQPASLTMWQRFCHWVGGK